MRELDNVRCLVFINGQTTKAYSYSLLVLLLQFQHLSTKAKKLFFNKLYQMFYSVQQPTKQNTIQLFGVNIQYSQSSKREEDSFVELEVIVTDGKTSANSVGVVKVYCIVLYF